MNDEDAWEPQGDNASDLPHAFHIEGFLVDDSDPVLTADEDGHYILSNIGLKVNEVGSCVPVRIEIYRGADKDTVLKMLEKMRAHTERYWNVNSFEREAESAAEAFEAQQRAPAEHDHSDATFGVCPICKGQDGFMNVGREHWFVCQEHKTKWFVGSNLFSSWRYQSEEVWEENARILEGYEEVEPAHE